MVVAACFDVRPKVAVASNLLAGQLLTDHAWAGIRAALHLLSGFSEDLAAHAALA
jgi:hypothetical protein